MSSRESGQLLLAATPIGSVKDASASLRDALLTADLIAAEDTRQFAALLRRLELQTPARVMSYFEGNEQERTAELVAAVTSGQLVVLVTDAGMPTVSDPGYRIVTACIAAGLPIGILPGPSAVTAALAVSGLPTDRFCFEGFLPRKSGERRRRLAELQAERRTAVIFEAPHRLSEFLTDAVAVLGDDRQAVVCRELTKPHQEIVRGPLPQLLEWAQRGVRGEVTLVLEGARSAETSLTEAQELVNQRMAQGEKMSGAVTEIAQITGVNRKQLYQAMLADKENK